MTDRIDELSDSAWRAVVHAQSTQLLEQSQQLRDLFDSVDTLTTALDHQNRNIVELRRLLQHAAGRDPELHARVAEWQRKVFDEIRIDGDQWDAMAMQYKTGRNIGKAAAAAQVDMYMSQVLAAQVNKPKRIIDINVC